MRCNFAPSLLWFEFGQLNSSCSILIGFLCAAAFSSFLWVCKSDISFCNTKQQFGCPIIQSFFPWPPFPPSDSYPADCVCAHKNTRTPFFLTDWQWQRGALPYQDMVHRDTKLQKQSVPQGWSSRYRYVQPDLLRVAQESQQLSTLPTFSFTLWDTDHNAVIHNDKWVSKTRIYMM